MGRTNPCLPRAGRRPIFLEFRSSTGFILLTVCIAIFTDIFLYSLIVPVFPFSLHERIGVPEADVQHWLSVLLAVYGAGLLVGAPVCGFLADRIQHRKWPLLFGLVTVLGATLLLCLAMSLTELILGRLLQGVSACVIWVVGLALLADTVESKEIANAMGYVAMSFSLAQLLGPLMGGIVYDKSGYYAVFCMGFGVIVLDIVLRLSIIEKKVAKKWLDPNPQEHVGSTQPGSDAPKETATIALEAEPNSHIATTPENNNEPSGTQANRPDAKSKRNLPPIFMLWTSRRMLATFWANLVLACLVTGFETTLTLFVNRTFGWSSLAAGILFLALLLPAMFGPLIGNAVDKYGSRWIGGFGILLTVPFLVLLRLVNHNSINQKVLLAALLFFIGLGMAAALTALSAEFAKICDDKEKARPGVFGEGGAYAQSYSIWNISWAAGSLVGAFWSGGIYTAADWGTLAWSWALLMGITTIPVFLFTDGWIGKLEMNWLRRRPQQQSDASLGDVESATG